MWVVEEEREEGLRVFTKLRILLHFLTPPILDGVFILEKRQHRGLLKSRCNRPNKIVERQSPICLLFNALIGKLKSGIFS